jgi:hypothetical protein
VSEREQIERAFERLNEVFGRLVTRAEQLAGVRCAYRDRADRCTASFGCPNQGLETPRVCRTDALNFDRA